MYAKMCTFSCWAVGSVTSWPWWEKPQVAAEKVEERGRQASSSARQHACTNTERSCSKTNGASGGSESMVHHYQPTTHSSIVVLHLEDNGDGSMGLKVGLHRSLAAASH